MEHFAPPSLTASAICDALGRKAIAERLNVGATAVSNASAENRFPASWYAAIKDMCEAAEIACPLDAFNWKGLAPEQGAQQ